MVELFNETQTELLITLAKSGVPILMVRRDTALVLDVVTPLRALVTWCAPDEVEERVSALRVNHGGVLVIHA